MSLSGLRKKSTLHRMMEYRDVYMIILIPLLALFVFSYIPMLGIIIAFKNYRIMDGLFGSEWIGFENFRRLFSSDKFYSVLVNTLLINFYKILFQFPLPIILALLLNEVRHTQIKRIVQTLSYLPHFLSWVIISGIFFDILSPSSGIVNQIIKTMGYAPISFMSNEKFFRGVIVASTAWKETGWSAIIYLAALTAIDPQLYDAASVDGAGKIKKTLYITIPGIMSTIVFILILRIGKALSTDTEQILLFYSPLVYSVGDVIGTYVYREGIQNLNFSYTTAVGIFTGVIGFSMMAIVNKISRRLTGQGIW